MTRHDRLVPRVVRSINLTALVILGVILVPAAAVRSSQVIPMLALFAALIGFYWIFQHKPSVSAIYLSLSFSLILWIIFCESIISVDNLLGSHVTTQLGLGLRLKSFAKTHLKHQDKVREVCCGDPLTWHYRPGSTFRAIFDCAHCNKAFEVLVDPSGYLNRQYEFIEDGKSADLFVAGDSVLEGVGTPGIVEFLNEVMPEKLWSLSANNYGPRQKVNALIAYAIAQHPRSLILEFYAGNDVTDAIVTESCASVGTFHCIFTTAERHRTLLRYEPFASMIDHEKNRPGLFDDVVGDSFTLAVTRLLISHAKDVTRSILFPRLPDRLSQGSSAAGFSSDFGLNSAAAEGRQPQFRTAEVAIPGEASEYSVLAGRWLEWVKGGVAIAFHHYDRLADALSQLRQPPEVILLYNPSAYEIYRNTLVERDSETDSVSDYQRQAIKGYAAQNGWYVIDLTDALEEEVVKRALWIFGKHDYVHWSTQGTQVVASVLARELKPLINKEEKPCCFGDVN